MDNRTDSGRYCFTDTTDNGNNSDETDDYSKKTDYKKKETNKTNADTGYKNITTDDHNNNNETDEGRLHDWWQQEARTRLIPIGVYYKMNNKTNHDDKLANTKTRLSWQKTDSKL